MILKTWFIEIVIFCQEVGLHLVQGETSIFGNILTGLPFACDGISKSFSEVVEV